MGTPNVTARAANGDADATSLTPDVAFEVLSNRRRRYVVHRLLQHGGTAELRALSRRIAAWENRKPLEQVTPEERRRVYNALQQFHLPKLRDAGVVAYESGPGKIRPTPAAESLRSYLGTGGNATSYYTAGLAGALVTAALSVAVVGGPDLPTIGATALMGAAGVVLLRGGRTSGRLGGDGPPPELARDRVEEDR
jgi:hypothetical protein